MSATNRTTNYGLPIFIETDKPTWLVDFNGAMNTIDGRMKTNADAITTATGNITTLQADMTTAQGNISTAQSNITSLQSSVYGLQSDVTGINTAIDTIEGDITDLQTANTVVQVNTSYASNTIVTSTMFNRIAVYRMGNILSVRYNLGFNTMTAGQQVTIGSIVTNGFTITASQYFTTACQSGNGTLNTTIDQNGNIIISNNTGASLTGSWARDTFTFFVEAD